MVLDLDIKKKTKECQEFIVNYNSKEAVMKYRVIPFVASINSKTGNSNHVAHQLEEIIKHHSNQGWTYLCLESVSTFVQPEAGCFGFGAKPGYNTSSQMVVFIKE